MTMMSIISDELLPHAEGMLTLLRELDPEQLQHLWPILFGDGEAPRDQQDAEVHEAAARIPTDWLQRMTTCQRETPEPYGMLLLRLAYMRATNEAREAAVGGQ